MTDEVMEHTDNPTGQDERPVGPPPIENDEDFEEKMREYAELEADKTRGQCGALQNLVDRYQYQLDMQTALIENKQARLRTLIEAYARMRLPELNKKQYIGAFCTVRLTTKQHGHEVFDPASFKEWALECAPHLLQVERKEVTKIDRKMIDVYMKEKGEIPAGVEPRDTTGFTIKPQKLDD